jgi:hypothetical protein
MAVTKNIRKKKRNNSRRKIRVGGTPQQEVAQEVVEGIVQRVLLSREAEDWLSKASPDQKKKIKIDNATPEERKLIYNQIDAAIVEAASKALIYDWSNIDNLEKLPNEPLLRTLISKIKPDKGEPKVVAYTTMDSIRADDLKPTPYNHREVENGNNVKIEFLSVNKNHKKWAPCILAINHDEINQDEANSVTPFSFERNNTIVLNVKHKFFKSTDNYHLIDFKQDKDSKGVEMSEEKTYLTHNKAGFVLLSNLLQSDQTHRSLGYYTHATPCSMGFHTQIIVSTDDGEEYIMLLPAKQNHLKEKDRPVPVIYKLGPGGSVKDDIKRTLSEEFKEETGLDLPCDFNPTLHDNINELEIKVNSTRGGPENTINEHPVNVNITSYIRIRVKSLDIFDIKKVEDKHEVTGFFLIPLRMFLEPLSKTPYKYEGVIIIGQPALQEGDVIENSDGSKTGTLIIQENGKVNTKVLKESYGSNKFKLFSIKQKYDPVFLIKSKFFLADKELNELNYVDNTLELNTLYEGLGLHNEGEEVEANIRNLNLNQKKDITSKLEEAKTRKLPTELPTGGLKKRRTKKYTKLRKVRKTRKTRKIRK